MIRVAEMAFWISGLVAVGAAFAVCVRFTFLRPSSLAFADGRSAELWRSFERRRPLVVFTESPLCAANFHVPALREALRIAYKREFDGPQWFVLCSLMQHKRPVPFLYDEREVVQV